MGAKIGQVGEITIVDEFGRDYEDYVGPYMGTGVILSVLWPSEAIFG